MLYNNIYFICLILIKETGIKLAKRNINFEFRVKVDEIKKKLRLPQSFCNIYLLNGKSIYELAHIPKYENIIIISRKFDTFEIKIM